MNTYWNRCNAALVLSLVLCVVELSQEEVSVSDFKYPETRAFDWKGGLSGSLSGDSGEFSTLLSNGDSRSHNANLQINSAALYFHSKENHDNLIKVSGPFDFRFSKNEGNRSGPAMQMSLGHSDHRSDVKSSYLSASWMYAHYFSDPDQFHFVGSVNFQYSGSYYKYDFTNIGNLVLSEQTTRKQYDLGGSGFAGIGYGRMREGTFVIRVLRILERLRENEVINTPLTRQQILRLVDKVAQTREYVTNFERYEKFLVHDIVKVLASEGVIPSEAMAPISVLKITEVLREQIEPRFFGARIYYAIGARHDQYFDDRTSEYYNPDYNAQQSHTFIRDGMAFHRIAAEYGRALSPWTHLNADASFELPNKLGSKFFNLNLSAKAIHQIGERIDVVGTYTFQRSAGNSCNSADDSYYERNIRHSLDAMFRFFLEDRVNFYTDFSYEYYWYNVYDSAPPSMNDSGSSHDSRFGITFGLNYNII